MNRLSQFLILVAGGFTTALLIAVYLESQAAAFAAWYLFFALVVTTIIWLAVFTIRNARRHLFGDSRTNISDEYEKEPSEDHTQDGLSILRERYARGELTDEQFERKLDRLLETDTPENAAEWREAAHERNKEKSLE